MARFLVVRLPVLPEDEGRCFLVGSLYPSLDKAKDAIAREASTKSYFSYRDFAIFKEVDS